MADRILVPLDGSPSAEQILVQVARLLRREDADVVLLRVVDVLVSLSRIDTSTLLAQERTATAAYLEKVTRTMAEQGIHVRRITREGPVAESILQTAVEEKATLIALSSHGRSGPSRWLLGSVAEKVLRSAPVPVLLMRTFASGPRGVPLPSGGRELPFRRILVPLDGSTTSLQAVPLAAAFAKLFGSEVDVLAVDVPIMLPLVGDGLMAPLPPFVNSTNASSIVAKGVALFQEKGIPARPLTAVGDPAGKILETADAEHADLIAMATHGWTGLTRWMLGSVAEKVLRHSTLPMLVIRPPAG